MSPLVNPAAPFRFRLSCPKRAKLWPPAAAQLDDACGGDEGNTVADAETTWVTAYAGTVFRVYDDRDGAFMLDFLIAYPDAEVRVR